MDKILIKNLEVFANHGVNAEEKALGQKFLIDAILSVDFKKAAEKDDINETVSYSRAIKVLTAAVSQGPYDLLEKTAEVLAEKLFLEFKALKKVKICLKKPMAPINAHFDYVAVRIKRSRKKTRCSF